ncbi:MAG TPA: DNA mismatch repair endonuclease MutL [Phycisphaerae bacterium]|nr:DNA mismatch repair endonuclease MutL [Phycisphaerae bacterium]HOM53034.1 DNA mismatch repair endonuclease MutL [Phycisphaerae bacterium]HOQ88388.1 DNA mismatch repair endonuclease MutL [Phycisphaerae bacterium]HPU27031.1 DNA mismatch repair endonuclease MutL [Phycisphaerae bacterium]
MPQIQVLPDLLVNKIAAGEVIERPASVVKELVENSIDAGASRIEIAVENGGQKLIRITDDGAGMDPEDLALSIRPHATSKIRREEDLFAIQTMGFRGEALPSIGAVSQLRIVSRRRDSDCAHEIRIAGDALEPVRVSSGPPGTTVEVRQLFFNVPARQKFLRTAQTEIGHITEQLARIALVHTRIEFRLTHNGRLVHHLRPAEAMRSRIGDFYGREMADALIEISREERGLRINGYVAPPTHSRSAAKWQYLFLNGRFIRDRFVSHAVKEAYRGLMDPNRHPVFFLALTIDPANVDVNVHPTKSEVRWRDSNMLYSQVLSALRDRFLNADFTPTLSLARSESDSPANALPDDGSDAEPGAATGASPEGAATNLSNASNAGLDADDEDAEARRRRIRESMAEFFKRARPVTGADRASRGYGTSREEDRPYAAGSVGTSSGSSERGRASGYAATPRAPLPAPGTIQPSLLDDAEPIPGDSIDAVNPDSVIQLHRCYLVAETRDGLMIIDQHALHERILFEQLSKEFSQGPLESQRLLLPEIVDVSPDQVAVIESHEDTLRQLGLELTAYGPGAIAIHAAPSVLKPERTREFVRDMLDRLADRQAPASTELLTNDLLAMMACKAAVKAGDPLSQEEIAALMAHRPKVERSTNCPHGRPTSLRLTVADLERQFKRTGF